MYLRETFTNPSSRREENFAFVTPPKHSLSRRFYNVSIESCEGGRLANWPETELELFATSFSCCRITLVANGTLYMCKSSSVTVFDHVLDYT